MCPNSFNLIYKSLVDQVVNPYKRYPLYTHRVCKIYLGKRRNEVMHNSNKRMSL